MVSPHCILFFAKIGEILASAIDKFEKVVSTPFGVPVDPDV